ncbi:diacylglycerol/lipid kinase family protein [Balneola sp. EhC07]|uniref:diacylglycerol/lipid kinase family protein n=1 Tax=Balneola sp. EhC07 TaxID=1849360 RepID=UPI000A49A3C3|nr:diacylglycerol kinase family protein [Balneola sp. EhC07]
MTYTLLVNCKSNSSRAENFIRLSEDIIRKKLPGCEIKYISSPDQLLKEASLSAQNSSAVIACGGDGTAQSIARGVHGSNALMGLIPVGSGNDFAKSIGLKTKKSIEYYLDVILKQQVISVDVPVINDQIFINTAGIGFDGLTNYYASGFKSLKGTMKYTFAGLKAFLNAKPFVVSGTIDGSSFNRKVWLIAVANGAVEGGKYLISPNSINSDRLLELVIVPAYNRLKLGLAFILLSLGRAIPDTFSEVITFKEASLKIADSHFIHLDGEIGESSSDYGIKLKSEYLNVLGIKSDE